MAENSVRKFNYEPEQQLKTEKVHHGAVRDPKKVPYSVFEKILLTIGIIGVAAMLTISVKTSISTSYAQQELTSIKESINKEKSKATDLKQEIGELTSISRLKKIAKSHGLKLRENNIRTIR